MSQYIYGDNVVIILRSEYYTSFKFPSKFSITLKLCEKKLFYSINIKNIRIKTSILKLVYSNKKQLTSIPS